MPSYRECANALRFLAIDAVEKAQSGHPGMPMGMADIAEVLWRHFLKHNPANPHWPNRDRFVLSNGHGAMLLYGLLHLTGYSLSLEDLKQFRQLHSKTPGHPEYGHTPGVEVTTGPLGQGLAAAVGMALAERHLSARFNQPDAILVDHYTYVFCGDGCLMEGISHEACSFAGTQGLGKLIVFWDDNGISIDGEIVRFCRDNTPQRFESYHWQVIRDVDGHDPAAIMTAIHAAQADKQRPTLICCKTHIGFGAPTKQDSAAAHGSPLGAEEVQGARIALNWPHLPFEIPTTIQQAWDARTQGLTHEDHWQTVWEYYQTTYPELAEEWARRQAGTLPDDFHAHMHQWLTAACTQTGATATRQSSEQVLQKIVAEMPELIGGSADLTGSNNTRPTNMALLSDTHPAGQYIEYGVREFAMSAIMNGMACHQGVIPYGGTFLTFADYARNAVRLAALMRLRVIFVYSHDSIALGEDGPTHQPIEHLAMLRMTPHLNVWRPADHIETGVAWEQALATQQAPSCIVLTRQKVKMLPHTPAQHAAIARGGYVVWQATAHFEAIILATGSEVSLAIEAATALANTVAVRVVSLPCVERFLEQSPAYQAEVLPSSCRYRLAIEAASADYWYRFVGDQGRVLGLTDFGTSAPGEKIYQASGFTTDNVQRLVKEMLAADCIENV